MTRTLLLAACAAAVLGCGKSSAPGPAPVLAVTLDGSPLAAGVLVQLVGPDEKAVATGTTDAAGKAVVRDGTGVGPPAGTYKLVLVDTGDAEENPMETPKKPAAKSRVPAAFGKAATTKATAVLDGSAGPFPVELKSR